MNNRGGLKKERERDLYHFIAMFPVLLVFLMKDLFHLRLSLK